MATIRESVDRLVMTGIASNGRVTGCSDAAIRQLESLMNVKLPKAYEEFLKAMGQSAGDFLVGTDIFISRLPDLRPRADALLRETNSPFRLSADIFVFLVHQGYQFMFFYLNQNDDPRIFYFEEGDVQPRLVFDHFTDWLAAAVDDEITAYRDARGG